MAPEEKNSVSGGWVTPAHRTPLTELCMMGCRRRPPVQTAEDGGHAHHHVGDRQRVGCVFARKLLELLSGSPISQEQPAGALEETSDQKKKPG